MIWLLKPAQSCLRFLKARSADPFATKLAVRARTLQIIVLLSDVCIDIDRRIGRYFNH
jgi:hypothetical protein